MFDEPTSGLDYDGMARLAALIRRIRDTMGCTILLVEHDMGLVMNICQTVCAISFGKLLAIGTPEEIFTSDYIAQLYHLERGKYDECFSTLEFVP